MTDVTLGIPITKLFVLAGLVKSGKAAKRLINEGGAKLNDETISDPSAWLCKDSLSPSVKLSAGKKKHVLVKLEGSPNA